MNDQNETIERLDVEPNENISNNIEGSSIIVDNEIIGEEEMMEELNSINNTTPIKNKKMYVGFYKRVFGLSLIAVVMIITALLCLKKGIDLGQEKTVQFREKSNIDYKICLKENNFYEEKCLNKDMKYVASLIDKIPIDFNYYFTIDNDVSLSFKYDIVGELIIADETGKNVYFSKNYKLLNDKTETISNAKEYSLKEKIQIDYSHYNKLANDFKSSYGLDTVSYLKIILKVDKTNDDKNSNLEINKQKSMSITIPLSERSVNIKMDSEEINDNTQVLMKSKFRITEIGFFAASIICLIIFAFVLYKIIRLLLMSRTKKSAYDIYLKKILTEYDRLIAETMTPPNLKESRLIKIKNFEELLDVRDSLKLPIMYYNITTHQKCYFFINANSDIYILIVKAVDLEDKK